VLTVKQITQLTMKGECPHDTSYAKARAKNVQRHRPSKAVYFMSGAPVLRRMTVRFGGLLGTGDYG